MYVLSIDFECWPQMVHQEITGVARPLGGDALVRQTERLLELLAREEVTATFFVLGITAQAWPALIRRIAEAGHEIASHGHTHARLDHLSPEGVSREIRQGRDAVANATGRQPRGFRAPKFSITRKNLWALEIIADHGFTYDSSIVPVIHRRYGIPGWPDRPLPVAGGRLVELPLATTHLGPLRVPVGGGGYWRAFPRQAILRALARRQAPTVLYLHPYQLDDRGPDAVSGPFDAVGRARAGWFRLVQSIGRGSVFRTLEAVLPRHRWVTAEALAQHAATTWPTIRSDS